VGEGQIEFLSLGSHTPHDETGTAGRGPKARDLGACTCRFTALFISSPHTRYETCTKEHSN